MFYLHVVANKRMKMLSDLRDIGVDCLTLGQYMQPTRRHLKVQILLRASLRSILGCVLCVTVADF